MKERLREIVRGADTPDMGWNLAREYLQARILLAFQEAGAMIPLAFQGGTALRFLFGLPRFSEDLDFALERPERGGFDLNAVGARVATSLEREGYEVVTRRKTERAVQNVMLAFPRLPHDLGLSPHESQRLRIRVEVDTQPPAGAGLETTLTRRHALLHLQHHDRPSLLAGKLHAVLHRRWTKGRDLFDLFWYLSGRTWPGPNLELLNDALAQTDAKISPLTADSWRSVVRERVAALDWRAAKRDVAPFLEPGPETELFDRERLLGLLKPETDGAR